MNNWYRIITVIYFRSAVYVAIQLDIPKKNTCDAGAIYLMIGDSLVVDATETSPVTPLKSAEFGAPNLCVGLKHVADQPILGHFC